MFYREKKEDMNKKENELFMSTLRLVQKKNEEKER